MFVVWACGAVGSALPWHGRGRGFESLQVHQTSRRLTTPPFSLNSRDRRIRSRCQVSRGWNSETLFSRSAFPIQAPSRAMLRYGFFCGTCLFQYVLTMIAAVRTMDVAHPSTLRVPERDGCRFRGSLLRGSGRIVRILRNFWVWLSPGLFLLNH